MNCVAWFDVVVSVAVVSSKEILSSEELLVTGMVNSWSLSMVI